MTVQMTLTTLVAAVVKLFIPYCLTSSCKVSGRNWAFITLTLSIDTDLAFTPVVTGIVFIFELLTITAHKEKDYG